MLRSYYQLEGMWGAKPVRVKLAGSKGLVKASELEDEELCKLLMRLQYIESVPDDEVKDDEKTEANSH